MEKKLKKAIEKTEQRISQSKDLIEKSRVILGEDQPVKTPPTEKIDKA